MQRKKPTMKQMAQVVSNLIKEVSQAKNELRSIGIAFHEYIEYKKDKNKFQKHMEKAINERREKFAKDRASNNTSNDR